MLRDRQEVLDHTDPSDASNALSVLLEMEEGLEAFDADWRFRLCNRSAELLLRRAPGSLNGKRLWDELPELIGTPTALALRRAMDERVVESSELYFEPLAGWFRGRIYPAPSGGILALFNNVTEQKTAEAALRRSEERWRSLADAIPQFVWVAKSYGDVQFLNAYWYEYTGLPKGRADFHSTLTVVHPDDLKIIENMWRDAVAEGREKTFEYRVRRASDGMYRWHRGFHRPERESGGAIIRWVGCGFDVHDLRMTREDLSVMAERQELAIDAGCVGLWDWEIESDKLNWSEQLYELHGLTPESFNGTLRAFTELIRVWLF